MSRIVFDVRNTREEAISPELQKVLDLQAEQHGEHWIGGMAHVSLDMTDPEEMPRGTVMLYDRDAKVVPSTIPSTLGQCLMVTPLLPRKGGYKDSDFQGEAVMKLLSENIPQFNDDPPSLDNRHPRTNDDLAPWGPELGQEDGMVGVYKVMEPNGRNARYYLGVRSAIPETVHQLRCEIARTSPAEGYTYGDLADDRRLQYIEYLGRRNGYRLLWAAAQTLGVPILNGVDGSHILPPQQLALEGDASTAPRRAEPEYVQTISSIQSIIQGGTERIAVYNGVTPGKECGTEFFTYVSPYDGMVRFPLNAKAKGLAMPVLTGRRSAKTWTKPLEQSVDDIASRAEQSSIVWEQQAAHPQLRELHPENAMQVDRTFLRVMQQCGWDLMDRSSHMIPVLVKVSNPALRRKN